MLTIISGGGGGHKKKSPARVIAAGGFSRRQIFPEFRRLFGEATIAALARPRISACGLGRKASLLNAHCHSCGGLPLRRTAQGLAPERLCAFRSLTSSGPSSLHDACRTGPCAAAAARGH